MKQRVLLASFFTFSVYSSVLCHLFPILDFKTIRDDDIVHNGLTGKNNVRIQDVFWGIGHDDSWIRLMAATRLSVRSARSKIKDCWPHETYSGPETLLSMIMDINEVFITDVAPEHHDVVQDLKYEFIKHSNRLWDKHKWNDKALSVDETARFILNSAFAFKFFQGQNNLYERDSMVQSQHELSAAFFTSHPAHIYAEGFQASIYFMNMVENLVKDCLREQEVIKRFPLEKCVPIPLRRPLADNKIASNIMHQDALLTWWKSQLSTQDPYGAIGIFHSEVIKENIQGLRLIGSQEHINVWKRLLGVVVTTSASKIEIQDKLSLLENYSQARMFFERLMHNKHEHNLGILKALYEILEIFETCDGRRDKKSFEFVQDVVNELFTFNEHTLTFKRETIVQRAKYMVMWWMLSQSIAKTVLKLGTDHAEVDYTRVLQYSRYLWHFMYRTQKFNQGPKYKDRQDRESFTIGKHYFIYIGCQLHLQDSITKMPLHLWPTTQNLSRSDFLEKLISLEKRKHSTFRVDQELHGLFSQYMITSVKPEQFPWTHKESKSSTGVIIQDQQKPPEKRKFSSKDEETQSLVPVSKLPRV
ncbi:hypothetical protein DFH28DRAFT_513785 [Melampsora americana]|nr:hypothetical protein DFH28DRAFT_513785 [Melampsora americana]